MGFSPDTLRDRVALVTGASQGIGRAIAVEMARVGAHVAVCSRRAEALEGVAAAVRGEGRKALAVACDVGDGEQVDAAVAADGRHVRSHRRAGEQRRLPHPRAPGRSAPGTNGTR